MPACVYTMSVLVVSCPMWVLGTEHGSFTRAARALSHGGVSAAPAPTVFVMWYTMGLICGDGWLSYSESHLCGLRINQFHPQICQLFLKISTKNKEI